MQSFKRFRFFTEEPTDVVVPHSVTCSATSGATVWLGAVDGTVCSLDRDLSIKTTFQAHQGRVHHVACAKVRSRALPAAPAALAGPHS